jgi:hypothetical protein
MDDRQGLTVETDPGGQVGYQTVYSDGTSIVDKPQQYQSGGQGGGYADSAGRFRDTWVVPAAAPLGTATVYMLVPGHQPIKLKFTIVGTGGHCP